MMKRLFLTGIATLFLATEAAHAREWQGNMPKPIGKLPQYPPVVCVTPNWTPESCEDRQPKYWLAALSKFFEWLKWTETNWLGTALVFDKPQSWNGEWPKLLAAETTHAGTVVVQYEKGGLMGDYADHWRAVAAAGVNVEIRRRCISACTQIMEFVPKEKVCFDKHGTLEFHMARTKTGQPLPDWTELWWSHQPQNIRLWLREKGWVQKATVEDLWVLTAEDLWAMGYRKCESNGWPQ